jgi:hypothetical protein
LFKHVSLFQPSDPGFKNLSHTPALVEQLNFPSGQIKHQLGIVVERLPNFKVINCVLLDPLNQTADKSHIHFVISFFLIRCSKTCRVDHSYVNLTPNIVAFLIFQIHWVSDACDEARLFDQSSHRVQWHIWKNWVDCRLNQIGCSKNEFCYITDAVVEVSRHQYFSLSQQCIVDYHGFNPEFAYKFHKTCLLKLIRRLSKRHIKGIQLAPEPNVSPDS